MGSQVTYCKDCGACNWAGEKKCVVCGGELEPTLNEVYAYLYTTDPEFKEFVDEQTNGQKDDLPKVP